MPSYQNDEHWLRSLFSMDELGPEPDYADVAGTALRQRPLEEDYKMDSRVWKANAAEFEYRDRHTREWPLRIFVNDVESGLVPPTVLMWMLAEVFRQYCTRTDTTRSLDDFMFRDPAERSRQERYPAIRDFVFAAFIHREKELHGALYRDSISLVAARTGYSDSTIEKAWKTYGSRVKWHRKGGANKGKQAIDGWPLDWDLEARIVHALYCQSAIAGFTVEDLPKNPAST